MHACMMSPLYSTQVHNLFAEINTTNSIFHSTPSKIREKIMEAFQTWVSEHKLTTIGTVWASAIGASLAFSRSSTPLKPSLRLIHARMHAQALTLAVLSGAAVYHSYEKRGDKLGDHN